MKYSTYKQLATKWIAVITGQPTNFTLTKEEALKNLENLEKNYPEWAELFEAELEYANIKGEW